MINDNKKVSYVQNSKIQKYNLFTVYRFYWFVIKFKNIIYLQYIDFIGIPSAVNRRPMYNLFATFVGDKAIESRPTLIMGKGNVSTY